MSVGARWYKVVCWSRAPACSFTMWSEEWFVGQKRIYIHNERGDGVLHGSLSVKVMGVSWW
jgi:hypothetical protein